MGNCVGFMSNTGEFEPPGSRAVKDFVREYDKNNDPRWLAVVAAEQRAERAEKAIAEALPAPKPRGPKCMICKSYVTVTVNPWQQTRSDLVATQLADDSDTEDAQMRKGKSILKSPRHGIELTPCRHVFCGACLAESIYRNLNVPFDPTTYGTKLKPATPGQRVQFPMGCPTCQVRPGERMVEISDMTAVLVLGPNNMDEWRHARFFSALEIMYCPNESCGEAFDANDLAPEFSSTSYEDGMVQCPRFNRMLCRYCKVVWHTNLTCDQFQELPENERAPEDLAFTELAQKERWRRCPKCRAMVERRVGCNHITCACKHHFCYTCGADFEYLNGRYRCTGGKGCKVWDRGAFPPLRQ
jgi:hypothetical protein